MKFPIRLIMVGFRALLVLFALAAVACTREHPAPSPPNVVLITIDALRADYLSYAGHPNLTSPNLDALAHDNVFFTQAVTSFPGTTASMPSLMTGLFPSFEGIDKWKNTVNDGFFDFKSPAERERQGVSSNLRTLAEILKDHGYITLGFHTNPNVSRARNFDQGFDEYFEFLNYLKRQRKTRSHPLIGSYPPANVVMRKVLDRLDRGIDRPMFLWIHLMESHSPYLPPTHFARMFPHNYTDLSDLEVNECLYNLIYTQYGDSNAAQKYPSPEDRGVDREALIDHARGLYEGEIRFCDHQLLRLFTALREHGLWDNSLVMVTADHGEEFLDHGHVIHHLLSGLKEELIRIPLILKLPSQQPAVGEVDSLVRMVDFAPTILDYAGLAEEATGMNGVSLRPLIDGGQKLDLTAYYSTIEYGIVRNSRWKYRLIKKPEGSSKPKEELFDIVSDPMETADLSEDRPDVLRRMRREYEAYVERLRARAVPVEGRATPGTDAIDPETAERLHALGYATDD